MIGRQEIQPMSSEILSLADLLLQAQNLTEKLQRESVSKEEVLRQVRAMFQNRYPDIHVSLESGNLVFFSQAESGDKARSVQYPAKASLYYQGD